MDEPTVGNALGFSLLLRDRKVLLGLSARILGPGLRLADYEAEVPGVEFPLETGGAAALRLRRCVAERLTLGIDRAPLGGWLRQRLLGRDIGGVVVEAVWISLAACEQGGVLLRVSGHDADGHATSVIALVAAVARGRTIAIEARQRWLFSSGEHDVETLWWGIAARLRGDPGTDALVLDPCKLALTGPFVAAGWKAPDPSKLTLHELSIERETIRMRFASEPAPGRVASALPPADLRFTAIGARVQAITRALRTGAIASGLDDLERLAESLGWLPIVHVAALEWLCHAARHATPWVPDATTRALRAANAWLEASPGDRKAERIRAELLARLRRHDELLQVSAAAQGRVVDRTRKARLDVAMAGLHLREYGGAARARALLEPWVDRTRHEPALAALQTQVSLSFARVEAGDPARARALLEQALQTIADGECRAHERLSLAHAMIAAGQREGAVPLVRDALREQPDHPELRAAARRLSDPGVDVSDAAALQPAEQRVARLAAAALQGEPREREQDVVPDLAAAALRVGEPAFERLHGPREAEPAFERESLGPEIGAAIRERVLPLARAGEHASAVALVEGALARTPADELLLSTLKELCLPRGDAERYLAALERGLEHLPPGAERDALVHELAATAADHGQAERVLAALDRLTFAASATVEALDLREWAVRRLGREAAEREAIDERLRHDPGEPSALARLVRLTGEEAAAEHLLELASTRSQAQAHELVAQALPLARRDRLLQDRAIRQAIELGARIDLGPWWDDAFVRALAAEDEPAVAELLELAAARPELAARVPERFGVALARLPSGPHLHRVLWARHEAAPDRLAAVDQVLDAVAAEHGLTARARAELFIAASDQIGERRDAGAYLRRRAEAELAEPEAFAALVDALRLRGQVPQVLRLLELEVETATTDEHKVATLKRLAHVHEATLGDLEAASRTFEAALALAPSDPDLLLPLLDHCFSQRDLTRAIELTERVLAHVTMGDTAFLALAHRAADAALAQGESETAAALLRRAAERVPGDRKTQDRVAELEAMQGDPDHRVRLLGAIAARQVGRARIEALEERARLLVDPLGRPERAIIDLELVIAEDPQRESAFALLKELYARAGRWQDVIGLLEREFPQKLGLRRCQILQEIAGIYRRELLSLPRAEQALRIALDHIGSDREHADYAEELRAALVEDLRGQGRYVDLSIYLERALEPEIDGDVEPEDLHPARAGLLVELARIYRGPLDDEAKASRIYERLEQLGRLPDEGLSTLARNYRRAGRHADLVRILSVRAHALAAAGELARKAAVDERIAELLEGPLARPHEAVAYYLDAYLADPVANAGAGARARVLLSHADAVPGVRRRLLDLLPNVPPVHRPALLTLLGDILAPHEAHEQEAEQRYREALAIDPRHGPAWEALGRLLARQGRLADAIDPLVTAALHPGIAAEQAAEDAAIAARALLELDRPVEAESVLRHALGRAPESQRALLELARLYQRLGRNTEQAIVLETLSDLPVSSMLAAEVAYRRAMLLMPAANTDPYCPEAERARAYLLESVSADAKHVAARQTLLDLATARLEWSIVAHMHYLAIRELPPGPERALVHLELAETYLVHLGDVESATRNIESAIAQAPGDLLVSSLTGKIAARLPDPRKVAERFERIASGPSDLDDAARARLWLLAADLRMSADDLAAAEVASQAVLDLEHAPADATAAAERNLELLADDEARDLRQQKSGLLRLLDAEEAALERLHILGRLREIGRALGDPGLVEWASREQLELAPEVGDDQDDLLAASAALREVYAERGDYHEVVALYEQLAVRVSTHEARSQALLEAARFVWHGLHDAARAVELLRRSLEHEPGSAAALAMLGEITRGSEDRELQQTVYEQFLRFEGRSAGIELELARLARALGRVNDAVALLRPLSVQQDDPMVRLLALRELDAILARSGPAEHRLPVLRRYLDDALANHAEEAPEVALELARVELTLGHPDGARKTVALGLEFEPEHMDLLRLEVQLLEQGEHWDALARSLERLASLTMDVDEQARLLVRAARVRLDRQSTRGDERVRRRAIAEARRLLVRACETAPGRVLPRAELLPLSFAEGRFDEVLELAIELRSHGHDDEPALILAGLTEALRHGQRSLARDLGYRHDAAAHERFLFPGLRQLLTEVATRGPLPRLDALLAAGAALMGGRVRLHAGLAAWAAGRPVQAGLALALARLYEAEGVADLARALYQITAFMAPEGPVSALVARLPVAALPTELDPLASGPAWGRSLLRKALYLLRDAFAGLVPRPGEAVAVPNGAAETRMALADTMLEPWRRHLQLPLPLAWIEEVRGPVQQERHAGRRGLEGRLRGGVGAESRDPPTVVLGPGVGVSSVAELRFRLAYATAGIAMGLAVIDGARVELADVAEAVLHWIDPGHVVGSAIAEQLVDHVAERAQAPLRVLASEREALAHEIQHWRAQPDGFTRLGVELERARMLFATRLSGQLDGALLALAHDRGTVTEGRPDPLATLRTDDAHWLLRALGLY